MTCFIFHAASWNSEVSKDKEAINTSNTILRLSQIFSLLKQSNDNNMFLPYHMAEDSNSIMNSLVAIWPLVVDEFLS